MKTLKKFLKLLAGAGRGIAGTVVLPAAILFFAAAASAEVDWRLSAEAGSGYESNIIKSPDIFENALSVPVDTVNPVMGSGLAYGEIRFAPRLKISRNHYVNFQYKAGYQRFLESSDIDEYRQDGSLGWEISPLRKLDFSMEARLKQVRELDPDKHMTRSSQKYLQPSLETGLEYSPNRSLTLGGKYFFRYKNYYGASGDTTAQESDEGGHDFSENEVALLASLDFPGSDRPHRLEAEFSWSRWAYGDYVTTHADTSLYPVPPNRMYHFLTGGVGYRYKTKWATPDAGFRMSWRIDPYIGYYNYREYRISAGLKMQPTASTSVRAGGYWNDRQYLTREAAVTGPNPKLFWKNLYTSLGLEQEITKRFSVFAEYKYYFRNTNTGYIDWSTERDYADHLFRGGVQVKIL